MPKCLVCFGELTPGASSDYHPSCALRLFGRRQAPHFDINADKLVELGLSLLRSGNGIPGVQKKLSVDYESSHSRRLTIVGFRGAFILKPQSDEYTCLPENEALCMELARRLGLRTAAHGLIRDTSGALAYISRRFDRGPEGEKYHQEDFCQISQRLTTDKYKGSLEAASKALRYSGQAGLDRVRFFELNLLCWLSGNADMHLKNFSLLNTSVGHWELSPAYDLLSTALALPEDREETALTINGKKARLTRGDFEAFAVSLGLPDKVRDSVMNNMLCQFPLVEALCRSSFLNPDQQERFINIWKERSLRLSLAARG